MVMLFVYIGPLAALAGIGVNVLVLGLYAIGPNQTTHLARVRLSDRSHDGHTEFSTSKLGAVCCRSMLLSRTLKGIQKENLRCADSRMKILAQV